MTFDVWQLDKGRKFLVAQAGGGGGGFGF
jgi:hypothetical protein